MRTKRIICIVMAVVLIGIAAGCGSAGNEGNTNPPGPSDSGNTGTSTPPPTDSATPPPPTDSGTTSPAPTSGGSTNLSGTAEEVLIELVEKTKTIVEAAGEFMYMSMIQEVTPDLSQNAFGLSEADLGNLTVSASSSLAAIGTHAHQVVIFEAKDSASAAEIKRIVAGRVNGKDGYDAQKWICAWPEQVAVVESGNYVLLIASRKDVVETAVQVFTEMAGSIGTVDIFYEHTGDAGGGGGMAPLPIG